MSENPDTRHKKEEDTGVWLRYSEAQETRDRLSAELKGWWKIAHPFSALRLYRERRAANEANRKAANRRLLEHRLRDPDLADLNKEQRRAIVVQEDRTLVVAGAGTGKTHTMVAKARDSIRTGIARPSQIAFLTFTRKAAQEIRSRCTELVGMEIGTLHHLARVVIELVEGKKPRLSTLAGDDTERLDHIQTWLIEAVREDPGLLLDLETRHQAFEMCHAPQGKVQQEVRVPPNRVPVKSWGEALIATTLHLANIPYEYETEFPVPEKYREVDGARYFPDFYLPDGPDEPVSVEGGIWLEHFANDDKGELPGDWDEDEPGSIEKYNDVRRWKERLHTSLGTRFVHTEFGDIQRCLKQGASFPDLLLRKIEQQGRVGLNKPSMWDVQTAIDRLKTEEASKQHWRIAYEIDKWIRTRRQQVRSVDSLNAAIRGRRTTEEARALYRLANPILRRYEQHLEESETVDHEGTILKAWQYLREGAITSPWTVILVDEYQDVNPAQAAFVHSLLKPTEFGRPSTGARLTAVGDDWQAIFGFQGGDVDLIRRFDDPARDHQGGTERVELKQTYRFGQPLADTTRRFVTRGADAIDREVVGSPGISPDPRWPSSVVIASSRLTAAGEQRLGNNNKGFTAGVLAALARIKESSSQADVLVVARRNAELERTEHVDEWGLGLDRGTIKRAVRKSRIRVTFSTVHKAKGTEADYVILLDAGPPRASEAAESRALERALRVFRGSDTAEEERRIWYVALTRARHKVYIIVGADTDCHSEFADELYHNVEMRYDVAEDELAELLEPMRPNVPCPKCEQMGRTTAVLAVRGGPNGPFVSCISYGSGTDHYCGHKERICEKCQKERMIRLGNGWARCLNPGCRHEAPLCRCEVPRPMVERRNRQTGERFWGCQRYVYGREESCLTTKRID